jgi:hypothetical protein
MFCVECADVLQVVSRATQALRLALLLLLAVVTVVDAFGKKKQKEAPAPPPPPPPPPVVDELSDLQHFWTIVGSVLLVWTTLWLMSRSPSFPPKQVGNHRGRLRGQRSLC